jgi:3-oxoacyl-[acyl-carrier-protein] synthase-1
MPLYLTALGIINALGYGKAEVARQVFAGARHGLRLKDDLIPGTIASVGSVETALPEVPSALRRYDCRNNRLALAALRQIGPEVTAAIGRYGARRIAVVLGTSTSGVGEGEAALGRRLATGIWPEGFAYSQQEPGNLALFIADLLGLRGPAYTVHTACSSSGKAFAAAERLIRVGFCDAALVGGADAICGLTLNGFHALEALSPQPCNPFSLNRRGTNIGEGAALFLLEPSRSAVALLGAGESSDAYHVSAPEPSGAGARLAMERALAAAGLPARAIAYVNLHGTATPLNDAMEGQAVSSLFGRRMPCSSTKGMTGHTLGAVGAIEAAFLWLALDPGSTRGLLPPHVWDGVPDPTIPALALVGSGTALPTGERIAMMSNSFAFGGSNVSLVLGRGW